jgi:hypothetical protein
MLIQSDLILFIYFLAVMGIELKDSCFQELYHLSHHSPSHFAFSLQIVSHTFVLAGFRQRSSYFYLPSTWDYKCAIMTSSYLEHICKDYLST